MTKYVGQIKAIMKVLNHIVDLILPPQCVVCRSAVDSSGNICASCWKRLNFISEPLCEACGYPFPYEAPGIKFCAACVRKAPPFDRARAALRYDEHSKGLVTGLKFSDKTHQAPTFAKLMATAGNPLINESDCIIPVPLHRVRLFMRRYNQAALLALGLAKISAKPVIYDMLVRKINTPPQMRLNRRERQKNVKSAFGLNEKYREKVKGKSVLLVDDVMTTGATIESCAKALKKSGAWRVNVLTLARVVEG